MKRIDQINVIPFIDIMLVLLAIVLTTATFISEGRLEIRLPDATVDTTPDAVASVEIAIDAHNELFYNGSPLSFEALSAQFDRLDPATHVILRVDASTPFDRFIAVVDQLQIHHLDRMTILTHRR